MTNIVKVEIGKGLSLDVDMDGIIAAPLSHAHTLYIGVRNMCMDAHASVTEKEYPDPVKRREVSLSAAQKKLDSLYRNEVRTVRASVARVPSDPVEAEATREARVFVFGRARGWEKGKAEALAYIAALAGALEMPNLPGKEKEVLSAAIAKRAAKPESIEAAKAIVEARKSIQVDTADLGL